ncbi:MAG: zinc-dependent metalloprotease [Myxococcaceae bacterium]
MFSNVQRRLSVALVVCAIASACGVSEGRISDTLGDQDFVRVSRTEQGLTVDAGADSVGTADNENFYLAINKSQLGQKWFLSAYLTQWHPAEAMNAARTLGTRVVTFKIQNGKLYVFDVTDGATWSDTLDPQRVIEAYPLVTNYAAFNSLPGSTNFVLVDPAAGLNRFELMSDEIAASWYVRFQVELSYLQKYKTLADGVSFEQVFTGYSEVPGPGIFGFDQPFRGQGTMSLSLRRYSEGAGFVAAPLANNRTFGSGNVQYVPNQPQLRVNAVKWNIKPGMQPIPWRISQAIARLKADPRLAGVDVEGAISRGITGWNDAFGFPVFSVVNTAATDSFGDDDKNFVVVDTNPGLGLAFANWRENPNTGEIRGASVYFSSVFVEGAIASAASIDGGTVVVDAGLPATDAGSFSDAGFVTDAGVVVDAGLIDAGPPVPTCAPSVVISQVYGGNGATATNFRNQDYVELHNRGDAPVALNGLSLQYGSATGTAAWQVIALTGTIPAGGYYLVGFAGAGTDGGTPLIAPDQASLINLSATAGKVALVQGTTALTGACPGGSTVIDTVGFGATANCSETRPAPTGGTTLPVVRMDSVACVDSNDNGADFATLNIAPRNTSAAPAQCGCTNTVPVPPLPFPFNVSADGGVNLTAPTQRFAPQLKWGSMIEQGLCALEARDTMTVPAGMTRKDFIELVITETIMHEVGHTLGLRHNFKGSLEGAASVMDYNAEEVAVAFNGKPGPYDVAAVRFLYGLSNVEPTQAFCTDEQTTWDAQCDRFDTTSNPLTNDLAPRFKQRVLTTLGGGTQVTFAQLQRITRYVRAPVNEAQRLEAFNALFGDVAPPLRADVVALGTTAGPYADLYARVMMENLFTHPAQYRDEIQVNPDLSDAAFRARAIQVAKDILVPTDGYRSFESGRAMIDVLKAMQHADALVALQQARAYFVANRNAFPVAQQPHVDDAIRRIDAVTSPYFQ